jgi:hypothetical protein
MNATNVATLRRNQVDSDVTLIRVKKGIEILLDPGCVTLQSLANNVARLVPVKQASEV